MVDARQEVVQFLKKASLNGWDRLATRTELQSMLKENSFDALRKLFT